MEKVTRCRWADGDPLSEKYHDEEWGDAVFDDKKQFEFLCLEVMQCGLSWMTVLRKREAMTKEFDNFDYDKLVKWDEARIEKALENPNIIRSRKKIEALIHNAKLVKELREEKGSFSAYLWDFFDGVPVRYPEGKRGGPTDNYSDMISRDMKKRGFKFIGSVTLYAHLQAAGFINDHEDACFKSKKPPVSAEDISEKWVYVKMDRPVGAEHPKHPGLIYPINYGYIPTLLGGDGEEQDVYLIDSTSPLQSACARVIAIIHRLDDNEDKWVATVSGKSFSEKEIREKVDFQESYYTSEITLL